MASEQDVMRLVAELVDKTTGPLAKIRKSWQETHGEAAKGSREATKAAREHAKAVRELHERLAKVRETTVQLVTPGFAAAGIAIGSVAEAIKSLVESARHYGEVGHQLEMLHRRTKISVGALREYEEMGERVDISSDAMAAGIAKFGDFMQQTARGAPDALAVWQRMPGLWDALGRSLQGLSRQEQLDKVIDFLPRVRDVDQRRTILAMLGLPEDLATITQKEIEDARRDAKQWAQDHPFSIENAERTREAWVKLEGAMRGIRADMEAAFAPGIADAAVKIDKFLADSANIKAFQEAMHNLAADLKQEWSDILPLLQAVQKAWGWLQLTPGEIWDKINSRAHEPPTPPKVAPNKSDWHLFGLFSGPKGEAPARTGKPYDDNAARVAAGIQPIAFGDGFRNPQRMLEDAIENGVLAALRDYAGMSTGQASGGSGAVTSVSYGPSARAAVARFGSARYPNLGTSIGYQGDVNLGNLAITSGSLKKQRERFARELAQKPWLLDKAGHISLGENQDPTANLAVIESAMNRAIIHGTSLEYEMRRHTAADGMGYYAGYNAHPSAKKWQMFLGNVRKALGGSNVSNLATDNSSGALAYRDRVTGHFIERSIYNGEHFFSPNTADPRHARIYEAWRRQMKGEMEAEKSEHGHGVAYLRDHIRHLHHHQVTGSAKVSVDLNGFPRGTRMKASASGMFKEVTLNRGRQMGMADQNS